MGGDVKTTRCVSTKRDVTSHARLARGQETLSGREEGAGRDCRRRESRYSHHHRVGDVLDGTNVCVGSHEHMLELSEFLVLA
jgi:hypothetical protein